MGANRSTIFARSNRGEPLANDDTMNLETIDVLPEPWGPRALRSRSGRSGFPGAVALAAHKSSTDRTPHYLIR